MALSREGVVGSLEEELVESHEMFIACKLLRKIQ